MMRLLLSVATAMLFGLPTYQSVPDLSGTWTFVSANSPGRGAGAPGNSKPQTISGAAFNCGTECTITMKSDTIIVSRSANESGVKAAEVTLTIGEKPASSSTIAKWEGQKLVISRSIGPTAITQTLSIDGDKLIVVSEFTPEGMGASTQTYQRKSMRARQLVHH